VEAVEGRGPTKGNTSQTAVARTQSQGSTSPGLGGVREAAEKNRNVRFTSVFLRHPPEVGAVCGNSARTDLCGGHQATDVPPATLP